MSTRELLIFVCAIITGVLIGLALYGALLERRRVAVCIDITERLAPLMHDIWTGWARWMIDTHSKDSVCRWERQITTKYDRLTEQEKESDRRVARRIVEQLAVELDGLYTISGDGLVGFRVQ